MTCERLLGWRRVTRARSQRLVHVGAGQPSLHGLTLYRPDPPDPLQVIAGTYPAGLGEPLNVIVSGASDAAVLADTRTDGGFQNWALSGYSTCTLAAPHSSTDPHRACCLFNRSLQFGSECGSVSIDNSSSIGHQANLGDGRGLRALGIHTAPSSLP